MKVFNGVSVAANLRWLAVFLLLYGLGVSVATRQAPFYMPDEGAHYLRAYEVSKLHLVNLPGAVGVDIPCGEYTVAASKYYPLALIQKKAVEAQTDPTCKVRTISTAGSYSFIPYLPAALALASVEKLNWTPEDKLELSRIANFSVWFSILFFSLTLLNGGRVLMGCLILMPSFFWQLVALSADGATLAFCFSYVCFVVRIAQRKLNVTPRTIMILVALAVLIGASKGVYAPVGLLAFGLWDRFPGKGCLFRVCVLSCPVVTALSIFLAQIAFSDAGLVYLGNNANPALQLVYVSQNPTSFLNLMFKTMGGMDSVSLVAPTYAVPNVGLGFAILIFTIAAIAILMVCSNFGVGKRFRLMAGILTAIVLVSLSLPLYLTYSPVQFERIVGLQGRYFLPVMPLIFVTLAIKVSIARLDEFFTALQQRIDWVILLPAAGLIVAVVNIR